jgi:PAT family beta-lactamase induction signal transducer AmpG
VNAYRISSLVPGSLALILADRMPWSWVFLVTALFMLPGLVMTLVVREPAATAAAPATLRDAVVEPFREFIERSGWSQALRGDRVHLPLQARRQHGDRARHAVLPGHGVSPRPRSASSRRTSACGRASSGACSGGLWMVRIGINKGLWLFGLGAARLDPSGSHGSRGWASPTSSSSPW